MTQFIDLRLSAVGGELARTVAVNQGTNIGDYTGLSQSALLDSIKGQNVLIATHGFNVNRADGISCLSNWASLLQLPQSSAFVGLLWPGDSVWAHGLDYPGEALVANQAGSMAAEFINANLRQAASVSFASHSLGARVVLSTISNLSLPVRRLLLMAPAIDDDCLTTEFSVLSSKKDEVLSVAFPLGNLFAGIIAEGHPWWRAALGHCGPAAPWPANFQAPFAIPDNWNFEHGNYLQIDYPEPDRLPLPVNVPPQGSPSPPGNGWQEAFSSALASTRFR
jgi:hypothetical protein